MTMKPFPARVVSLVLPLALVPCLAGCGRARPPQSIAAAAELPVRFREVTRAAGIDFAPGHGGKHPLTILETAGCGGAFLDYDQDGWLDVFLVGQPSRAPGPACALYRNRGDGTFTDVTRAAGLDRSATWMGCAVGDYDNDGYPDLLLTGYGTLALFHNEPGGSSSPAGQAPGSAGSRPAALRTAGTAAARVESRRFVDVTQRMGLRAAATDWFTSAGWADVDRDGYLDLYVARYVRFDPHTPQYCSLGLDAQGHPVQGSCGPELYAAERGVFYHNRKGQRFEEATARFGLDAARGKGFGVAFGDFNGDGWPDLYLANDRTPGDLFQNHAGRRFTRVGAELGIAYSGDGRPQAGMGVDWGDYDNDGRLDLIVTTFFQERKSLYHNEGPAGFREVSDEAGLAPAIRYVGWGSRWVDADNDALLDWVVANGHAVDNMDQVDPAQPYPQPAQLFHHEGELFREIGAQACPALARPIAGRGVAVGDFDNDGRADLLVTNAEGEPLLLHNESAPSHHWLRVTLTGRRSNRGAVGARVWLTAGPVTQMREVTTGGSYLSASDPRLLFGLGSAARTTRLRVRWPGGAVTTLTDLAADRPVTLTEP